MHNCGHKTRSKSSHSEKPTSHNLHPRRTARTPEPHTEPTPVQNACLAASEPSSQPQSSCRAGLQIGLPRMCTIPRYMSSRLACPCVNSRSRRGQGTRVLQRIVQQREGARGREKRRKSLDTGWIHRDWCETSPI
jgi:hypothetical protein